MLLQCIFMCISPIFTSLLICHISTNTEISILSATMFDSDKDSLLWEGSCTGTRIQLYGVSFLLLAWYGVWGDKWTCLTESSSVGRLVRLDLTEEKQTAWNTFYKLQLVSDRFAFSMTKCAKWILCVRHLPIHNISDFFFFLDPWREYKIKNKPLATCNDDACKPFCSLQSWLVCAVLRRRHISPIDELCFMHRDAHWLCS